MNNKVVTLHDEMLSSELRASASRHRGGCDQGLVKGAKLCFRNPYFYFRHGESTSRACQLTSPVSQKSKDLNKVPLLLQDQRCHGPRPRSHRK